MRTGGGEDESGPRPSWQFALSAAPATGAVGISLWDDRKSADAYQTAGYPQVLAKLTPVIEGTPKVETYETASSYLRA